MKPVDAFLFMTGIAYWVAAVMGVLLGIPFDRNVEIWIQSLLYILMGSVILVALILKNSYLYTVLGVAYVFVALLCYAGEQDWGSTAHNLFMCAWDLLLAVSFLTKL